MVLLTNSYEYPPGFLSIIYNDKFYNDKWVDYGNV